MTRQCFPLEIGSAEFGCEIQKARRSTSFAGHELSSLVRLKMYRVLGRVM